MEDFVYMSIFLKRLFLTLFIVLLPSLGFANEKFYRNEVTTYQNGILNTIKTYDPNDALVQSLTFSYTKLGNTLNFLPGKIIGLLDFEVKVDRYSTKGAIINTVTQKGTYDPGITNRTLNASDMTFNVAGTSYETESKEVASIKKIDNKTQVKLSLSRNSSKDFVVKEITYKVFGDSEVKTEEVTCTYDASRRLDGEVAATLGLEKNLFDPEGKIQEILKVNADGSYTNIKYATMEETWVSMVETYYPDGTLKYTGKFVNGKPNGVQTSYFDNGLKSVEETYVNGILNGTKNEYYKQTGSAKSQKEFQNGDVIKSTNYNTDGKITSETEYVKGRASNIVTLT
jgi:antitoxin component YwqK of YwqJK toxin-antitoxin module